MSSLGPVSDLGIGSVFAGKHERPELPEGLCVAVDVALEPDPADRWADASEMSAALRPVA